MSIRTKGKKGPSRIKLMLLGDDDQSNKTFIKAYLGKGIDAIEKNEIFEFSKKINEEEYLILFGHLNDKDDKMVQEVQETNCVFILFDMSERISFDNLLDKWLIWLRDFCKFEGTIIIFGDYLDEDNPDLFLATSEDEVHEVIKCSELKAVFKKIGNLNEAQRREGIDDVIKTLIQAPTEQKAGTENEGGSMKGGCFIF